MNESVPPIKRQSAVLYLASFISRALYVSANLTSEIVSDLVTWCGSYVSVVDSTSPWSSRNALPLTAMQKEILEYGELDELGRLVPPDSSLRSVLNRHETFYCAVQATCYICCFHGVEIGTYMNIIVTLCIYADIIYPTTHSALIAN